MRADRAPYLSVFVSDGLDGYPFGRLLYKDEEGELRDLEGGGGGGVEFTDFNTLAKLNTILTDATLIDTGDSRLSDARTPTAHTHPAAEISDSSADGRSILTAADFVAIRALLNVEDGATADQSNAEIETAYNAQVSKVTGPEITAADEVAVRRFAPVDILSFIQQHAAGGLSANDINTLAKLNAIVADATLIDTGDSRLSDARAPIAHTHPAAQISDSSADGRAILTAADFVAIRALLNVEDGATADQTNSEIETAYHAQVPKVTGPEITAADEVAVRRYSPVDILSFIQQHAAGGLSANDINTLAKLNAIVADATLIDTGDSRLSDARTPTAHTHTEAEISNLGTAITLNADADVSGNAWVLDEDNFASDSNTKVPTQQSAKAYVDAGLATKAAAATSGSYAPTITATGSSPTEHGTATKAGRYRKQTNHLGVWYYYSQPAASPGSGTGPYRFSLPAGESIDLAAHPVGSVVGTFEGDDGAAATTGVVLVVSATTVEARFGNAVMGADWLGLAEGALAFSFKADFFTTT